MFFRYLQICVFTHKYFPSFPSEPLISLLAECLKNESYQAGSVSKVYNIILKMECYSLQHLKEQWEGDLDTEFFEEIWQKAIQESIHPQSVLDTDCYSLTTSL